MSAALGDGGVTARPLASSRRRSIDASREQVWGWLPAISVIVSLGLALVAVADARARESVPDAELLFWLGVVTIFTPIAARLGWGGASRAETFGIVAILALLLYAVKLLHSPAELTFPDEFYHWRTTDDIVRSRSLFQPNPLLPVSALYPGLDAATSALASVSGLGIFGSGVVLIAAARLVLVLALFLLFEHVSGSTWAGGIAASIYAANPNFVFFGAAFKYESLGLALAALTVYAVAARERAENDARIGLTIVAFLAVAATVTTHHLTSYLLTTFLVLWTLVRAVWPRPADAEVPPGPGGVALLALVASAAWLIYVAIVTVGYVLPSVRGAITEIVRMINQEPDAGRELFRSSSGQLAPLWERVCGLGGTLLVMLGLPVGLLRVWKVHRHQAIAVSLALAAVAYPLSLSGRLTVRGWEIANRATEFLFVGVGFTLAIAAVWMLRDGRLSGLRRAAFTVAATVVFIGGVIAGWPPAWRLPWPYLVDAGPRSIEPEGVTAAYWTAESLGRGRVIGADKVNMFLMGSYGGQAVTHTLSGGVNAHWIIFARKTGGDPERLLRRGKVEYLAVDQRLGTVPLLAKRYYADTEMDVALDKFNHLDGVSRLFDSGGIVIYDVRVLSRGQ
ncbi:MAG: hypothetical protein U0821_22685 [Chloroflexota bacterium]